MSSFKDLYLVKPLAKYFNSVIVSGLYPKGAIGEVADIFIFTGGYPAKRFIVMDYFYAAGCIPFVDIKDIAALKNCFIGGVHAIQFSHKNGELIAPGHGFELADRKGRWQ